MRPTACKRTLPVKYCSRTVAYLRIRRTKKADEAFRKMGNIASHFQLARSSGHEPTWGQGKLELKAEESDLRKSDDSSRKRMREMQMAHERELNERDAAHKREIASRDAAHKREIASQGAAHRRELNLRDAENDKMQLELAKALGERGSYIDGGATPSLLESTIKKLEAKISSFMTGLSVQDGPFLQHFIAADEDPWQTLVTSYGNPYFTRPKHVTYLLKGWILQTLFANFENEGFTSGGVSLFFDKGEKKTKYFQYFEHIMAADGEVIYISDKGFQYFCLDKLFAFLQWPSVFTHGPHYSHLSSFLDETRLNAEAYLMPDMEPVRQLFKSFISAAAVVWAIHKLCNSFETKAEIFRAGSGSDFNEDYMNAVVSSEDDEELLSVVGFMVSPGFSTQESVLKVQVYLAGPQSSR